MEELSIKVNIANRYYPMTATAAEEETIRKAAKLVNDRLKNLQQLFAVNDMQDMLAMVCLEIATGKIQEEDASADRQSILYKELETINTMLNSASR